MEECNIFKEIDEVSSTTEEIKAMANDFVKNVNQKLICHQLNVASFLANEILPDFLRKRPDQILITREKHSGPKAIIAECEAVVESLSALKKDWIRREFVKEDSNGAYIYTDDRYRFIEDRPAAILQSLKNLLNAISYSATANLDSGSTYRFLQRRGDQMEQIIQEIKNS